MATNLTKSIKREIQSPKHGALTIEVTPHGIITRPKGSPAKFGPVPWAAIHDLAMKIEAGHPTMARRQRGRA